MSNIETKKRTLWGRIKLALSRTRRDERGLSTLEWILLVAAVGGLATAGVIIVRNAVGGAGDQVDDTARTERIAQREVDAIMRQTSTGGDAGTDNGGITPRILDSDIRTRCKIDYKQTISNRDVFPNRKWRGSFTLQVVRPHASGAIRSGASNTTYNGQTLWCDVVPTNNLTNNGVDISGYNPRTNRNNIQWTSGGKIWTYS